MRSQNDPKQNSNKKQNIVEKQEVDVECASCKKRNLIELHGEYYCQNCEHTFYKQKHQIDRKVLGHDKSFSTRLPFANKKLTKCIFP